MTAPAPSDQAPAVATTTPGWYPDPWQRHQSRFHDGAQWTEHVADGGFSGLDTEPVVDMPRSRPHPEREAPPEGSGPRVLEIAGTPAGTLEAPLLLVDQGAGPTGRRDLLAIDDSTVGWVDAPRPAWPRRLVRSIVTSPSTTLTVLVVRDAAGSDRLRVRRPRRRIAAVADVSGPAGALGKIEADRVRQGLRATVRAASGEEVGVLEQTDHRTTSRRIVDGDGRVLARLTAVWDVPGPRIHLPPGVLLLDRSTADGATPPDPGRSDLLLGALLAADLLRAAPAAPRSLDPLDSRGTMAAFDPPVTAIRDVVARALAEDLTPLGDISAALLPADAIATAEVRSRAAGVLAGTACFAETLAQVDPRLAVAWSLGDGDVVAPGDVVGTVDGPLAPMLTAERTALNLLSHLSGVATLTRRFVDAAGPGLRVWDTRKTTPGLRALEKAAVHAGGGANHRGNLSEWVMLKDNHLELVAIADAVGQARAWFPARTVHVECDTHEKVVEALAADADALLLDNMEPDEARRCVATVDEHAAATGRRRPVVEISGGITLETVRAYATVGADLVSSGSLTNSAPVLDIGLDVTVVTP